MDNTFTTHIIKEDITAIAEYVKKDLFCLEGKNILIAGASGMIGSYITYVLLYANEHFFKTPAQLYLLTRNKDKKFGAKEYTHYVYADITKELSLPPMQYLVHAASKAAPKLYTDNMIDTLNTNILGMYTLLNLCTPDTESFLYISSAEIYGNVSDRPVEETYIGTIDHMNKRSCYVEAKRASETIAINYFWEKKVPVKIARLFHTFGPGVNLLDGRVFSDFLRSGLEKKDIVIQGDPRVKRSMLYLKDATIMLLKILLSRRNGEVYNVGNETNVITIKEFAGIICAAYNQQYKEKISVVEKKDNKNVYYVHAVLAIQPSLVKFKKDFGFSPTTNIKEAIARTVEHLLKIEEIVTRA